MAYINHVHVFVLDETVNRSVESVSHPVETGVKLSDHILPQPVTVQIKGQIVGTDAQEKLNQILTMMNTGALMKYIGRTILENAQILSFRTTHPNTIWGGMSFEAEIKEVRIAKSSYNPSADISLKATSNAGTQQKEQKSTDSKVYHTVKKGDTVWDLVAKKNAPYKQYGFSCQDVMNKNPHAFSRKGDFRTLQIGKKLWVGNRKG